MTKIDYAPDTPFSPANDHQDDSIRSVQIDLHKTPICLPGHSIIRNDIDQLPQVWDGDFDSLDLLPIPQSCLGSNIFRAFAERRNLTASLRQFLLSQVDLPAWWRGKHLMLLGTEFRVSTGRFSRSRSCVYGVSTTEQKIGQWQFYSTDTLHHVAYAVVMKT